MLKLYFSPGACSLAPHIALIEASLPFDTESVNLKTHEAQSGDYLHINPKGYVPALKCQNGEILTEASVILQYIADQVPGKNLIPKQGSFERYHCQEWLNFVATEIHKGVSPLWKPDAPEEMKIATREKVFKRFQFLEDSLSDRTFLMGDHYTVADTYLFTILNWSKPLKIDLTRWPRLMGFHENIKSRPATQAALKSEGLLK